MALVKCQIDSPYPLEGTLRWQSVCRGDADHCGVCRLERLSGFSLLQRGSAVPGHIGATAPPLCLSPL